MNRLANVLRRVEAGESAFRPENTTLGALKAFQPVARALAHAKQEGLIARCELPMESIGGRLFYSAGYIVAGLTYKGEEFLRSEATFRGKLVRYGVPALKWGASAIGGAIVATMVTKFFS